MQGYPGVAGGGVPVGQLAYDEYGNPFVILKDQDVNKRLKGIEAHKANILAGKKTLLVLNVVFLARFGCGFSSLVLSVVF